MKLNKLLLTEKEMNLFQTAKTILEGNYDVVLTGSLALAIQGIKKPRESDDIDLCSYACNLNRILKKGALQIGGNEDKYDDFFAEFELNGEKIHYLKMNVGNHDDAFIPVWDDLVMVNVLNAKHILEYKLRHAFDTTHGHPEKHKSDLIHILQNNEL